MYLLAGLMAVIFAVLGYLNKKADKVLFTIEILILTFMLCLRYGQGTDYFAYEMLYSLVPQTIDISFLFHNDLHGEIGYTFFVEVFRNFGAPFPVFVAVWSFVMMLMTYYGIKSYGGVKTIAVLLLFPTYYLTFYYGVRQGFALAFTICFILPAYIKDKKLKYLLLVCLGAAIHQTLLILFVLLAVWKIMKKQKQATCVGCAVMAGTVLGIFLKGSGFSRGYVHFDLDFTPSYAAIALRVILFAAITRLYLFSKKEDEVNDRIYQFYLIGFCIFAALSPVGYLAHRATAYMKISEIVLFSRLLGKMDGVMYARKCMVVLKRHVCLLIMAICVVEGVKNINSYVEQGEYYSQIHFYNYPYVSVFHKEDIYKYRENEYHDKY